MNPSSESALRRGVRALRRLLPRFLFEPLRSIGTALWTPLTFSVASGHLRSSFCLRAVDKRGNALPWYTYPAIDFLSRKDFHAARILEWGAGQSTLWWAARAHEVVAIEGDPAWADNLRGRLPANATLHLADPDLKEIQKKFCGPFDVIIVDGLDRLECARLSLDYLAEGGAILLDNSDGTWSGDGSFPILELFRGRQFSRVDFYGYVPGVSAKQCTSLFFNKDCFLLAGTEATA
jgi:hypothetical protein